MASFKIIFQFVKCSLFIFVYLCSSTQSAVISSQSDFPSFFPFSPNYNAESVDHPSGIHIRQFRYDKIGPPVRTDQRFGPFQIPIIPQQFPRSNQFRGQQYLQNGQNRREYVPFNNAPFGKAQWMGAQCTTLLNELLPPLRSNTRRVTAPINFRPNGRNSMDLGFVFRDVLPQVTQVISPPPGLEGVVDLLVPLGLDKSGGRLNRVLLMGNEVTGLFVGGKRFEIKVQYEKSKNKEAFLDVDLNTLTKVIELRELIALGSVYRMKNDQVTRCTKEFDLNSLKSSKFPEPNAQVNNVRNHVQGNSDMTETEVVTESAASNELIVTNENLISSNLKESEAPSLPVTGTTDFKNTFKENADNIDSNLRNVEITIENSTPVAIQNDADEYTTGESVQQSEEDKGQTKFVNTTDAVEMKLSHTLKQRQKEMAQIEEIAKQQELISEIKSNEKAQKVDQQIRDEIKATENNLSIALKSKATERQLEEQKRRQKEQEEFDLFVKTEETKLIEKLNQSRINMTIEIQSKIQEQEQMEKLRQEKENELIEQYRLADEQLILEIKKRTELREDQEKVRREQERQRLDSLMKDKSSTVEMRLKELEEQWKSQLKLKTEEWSEKIKIKREEAEKRESVIEEAEQKAYQQTMLNVLIEKEILVTKYKLEEIKKKRDRQKELQAKLVGFMQQSDSELELQDKIQPADVTKVRVQDELTQFVEKNQLDILKILKNIEAKKLFAQNLTTEIQTGDKNTLDLEQTHQIVTADNDEQKYSQTTATKPINIIQDYLPRSLVMQSNDQVFTSQSKEHLLLKTKDPSESLNRTTSASQVDQGQITIGKEIANLENDSPTNIKIDSKSIVNSSSVQKLALVDTTQSPKVLLPNVVQNQSVGARTGFRQVLVKKGMTEISKVSDKKKLNDGKIEQFSTIGKDSVLENSIEIGFSTTNGYVSISTSEENDESEVPMSTTENNPDDQDDEYEEEDYDSTPAYESEEDAEQDEPDDTSTQLNVVVTTKTLTKTTTSSKSNKSGTKNYSSTTTAKTTSKEISSDKKNGDPSKRT